MLLCEFHVIGHEWMWNIEREEEIKATLLRTKCAIHVDV